MPRRPNVVLIVLDTVRARNLDLYGYPRETMPHLARHARRGVVFARGFSTSCWTLPAHASLFTGLLPSGHRCHELTRTLPGDVPTLATLLAEGGYDTAAFTNNAWVGTHSGLDRGFAEFFKGWQIVQSKTDITRSRADAEGNPRAYSLRALLRALVAAPSRASAVNVLNAAYARVVRNAYDSGARRLNGMIRRWLRLRTGGRPYFLFVNYLEAHVPYRPPRPFRYMFLPPGVTERQAMALDPDQYRHTAGSDSPAAALETFRALYDGELRYLDVQLNDLLDGLASRDDTDDTLVIIVGDHGENFGEHHLMGHIYNLYETVLHVPFVAIYPRALPGGATAHGMVQLTDVLPTVLELAGVAPPEGLEGRSLSAALDGAGRPAVRAELMGPMPTIESVLRQAPDAIGIRRFQRQLRSVRTDGHKLIVGSDGTVELYDLARDPLEDHDLAGDSPDLVAHLRALVSSPFDAAGEEAEGEIDAETRRALYDLGYLT